MANNKPSLYTSQIRRQLSTCQIIFPEDESATILREPIKYPGDELSGYIKVVAESFEDIQVDVLFEGKPSKYHARRLIALE